MSREAIRTAILGSKGQVVNVDAEGVRVEVRSPTFNARHKYLSTVRPLGDTEQLDHEGAMTLTRATLELVISCAYTEAGERVFGEGDVEHLMNVHHGPLLKGLTKAAMELLTSGAAEMGKASGATTSSPSPAPSESASA